jgi:hypothetical protein
MNSLADFGSPLVGVGILLAVAVALAFVLRRRARARAMRAPPPIPEPVPAETGATFLDSSHILDGPIIGRTPERELPVEPDRTGKR